MKTISVNNGGKIIIKAIEGSTIEIIKEDSRGGIEYSYNISDGDLVMLLNYYLNCKKGIENSDYISEGSVYNTNITDSNGNYIETI